MGQELQTFLLNLLPPARSVHLTKVTVELTGVRLQLTTTAPAAACPRCARPSSSVHSRYQRHLTDLPWGPVAVRIRLAVWKFVCRNLTCPRRLFTERVPELVAPYARKTHRLIAALQALGVALGGQAGARPQQALRPARQSGHAVAAGAPSTSPNRAIALGHWGR